MSVAETVRNKVSKASVGSFFTVSDFPGSRRAVESALSRLAAENPRVVRVRKGLYWKGVRSPFGVGRPRPREAIRKLAGRGSGPTGWSASYALGLSTQVPPVEEYVTVRVHSPTLRGVRFHGRTNLDRTSLNEAEIALLEVLRAWPRYVEADWADVVSTVGELESKGVIRLDRVFKVGMKEKSPQARDLLRRLAEDLSLATEQSA